MECKDEGTFVAVGGFKLVYHPGGSGKESGKKHPCPDCHFCQQCGDSRCRRCREAREPGKVPAGCKLSLREQVKLFDEINRTE